MEVLHVLSSKHDPLGLKPTLLYSTSPVAGSTQGCGILVWGKGGRGRDDSHLYVQTFAMQPAAS